MTLSEKRIDHLFYTSIAAIVLVVVLVGSACVYHTYKVSQVVERGDLNEFYENIFTMFGKHTATWDKYIQANELEKAVFWQELDSLRHELNMELMNHSPVRGGSKDYNIFTKL